MRNRAKCKLCLDVIESKHQHDYVTCDCGEIAVDGGQAYFKCLARDWKNFIRLDDDDNEITPKIVDKEDSAEVASTDACETLNTTSAPSKDDLLDQMRGVIEAFESLPTHAKSSFVTNYDLESCMLLCFSLFKELCKEHD